MKGFVDIHTHIAFGLDDGAKSIENTIEMIKTAKADGTDYICMTPHFHTAYYKYSAEQRNASFEQIKNSVDDVYIFFGNELHYSPQMMEWLKKGECLTINNSKYVLIDFYETEEKEVIFDALHNLLSGGYKPILAHTERYGLNIKDVMQLKESGIIIQVNAMSVFGQWGFNAKRRSRAILKRGLADLVCSDAHNMTKRPPTLKKTYEWVAKKTEQSYADDLFINNGKVILNIH